MSATFGPELIISGAGDISCFGIDDVGVGVSAGFSEELVEGLRLVENWV